MDHPRAILLAKLAAAALWMTSSGCTASYRAVTATGLDRPVRSLAYRARGEHSPPAAVDSVPLSPIPRFHPVPVRPVLLPEGAAQTADPAPHDVIPPVESPPPVDREVPAHRAPSDAASGDLLVRDRREKVPNPDESAPLTAHSESTGWRTARHRDTSR